MAPLTVWVLLAISPDRNFVSGLSTEFVAVYASTEACEGERGEMQRLSADFKYVCQKEAVIQKARVQN